MHPIAPGRLRHGIRTHSSPADTARSVSSFPALRETSQKPERCRWLSVGLDLRLERPGYDPFPARDLGVLAKAMSRPLIEFTLRQRIKQHANITLRESCRAQDVVASPDGAVSAVRLENGEGRCETLPVDLVVDASGRGNLTLSLLESLGRPH